MVVLYISAEDFESGIADVKCASIFSDSYPVKCKDFWDQPCTKGGKHWNMHHMNFSVCKVPRVSSTFLLYTNY